MSWRVEQFQERMRQLRYMTPEARQASINEKRMLKARGLCVKCKTEPRAYNQTICRTCQNVRQLARYHRLRKESKDKYCHEKRMAFVDSVLKHRCCICREWLLDPFTKPKKGFPKIRYACNDCYKSLWAEYRIHHDTKPFSVIREKIRVLKLQAGIFPKTAWEPLQTRRRHEVYYREMR